MMTPQQLARAGLARLRTATVRSRLCNPVTVRTGEARNQVVGGATIPRRRLLSALRTRKATSSGELFLPADRRGKRHTTRLEE
eukprot:scaffold2995_cov430-Prasinococcus_capsulatus_cf.AAC.1